MTRQEYREKLTRAIMFRSKIFNDYMYNYLSKIDFDELIMHYIDSMDKPETLMDCHNQFLWIKRNSNYLLSKHKLFKKQLKEIKKDYNDFTKTLTSEYIEDLDEEKYSIYKKLIRKLEIYEKYVVLYEEFIIRIVEKVEYICKIYNEEKLSIEKFSQLISVNAKTAKLNIKQYELNEQDYYECLFGGIEDDGSDKDILCNKNSNMPFFNLINKNIRIHIDKNKDIKQKILDYTLHDMGLAKSAKTIKCDENGEMKMEQYYPKLKVIK